MDVDYRFTCVREPSGKWTVWDRLADRPARLGGCVLIGRTELRARSARDILARIYGKRLDFASVRARHGVAGAAGQKPSAKGRDGIAVRSRRARNHD